MSEDSGFEELRRLRLGCRESMRENEFEDGVRRLLSQLYPDNAHFIYELLQNAEDARATTVEFSLGTDRLTVIHNGARTFSLEDIRSITSIGQSTKSDDETTIGRFGVGFKAVFAYTNRPEIRSGPFSFAIEDMFVPALLPDDAVPGRTTFVFPFDREEKPARAAVDDVERGLTELGEQTLLFLTHIDTITYELPDGRVGIVERRTIDERILSIRTSEGDDFRESHWLRLTGPASVDPGGAHPLAVAAAFRMDAEQRSIVPVADGEVSIYFPAVKESSGLRFHIHAPFASTVARDSVRDDEGNDRLVADIAALIAGALPDLRDRGLVNEGLFESLPNDGDGIRAPYTRIRDAVTEAFNTQDLTPVRGSGGHYARARDLVSSPGEFRRLLQQRDLPALLALAGIEAADSPRWIRGLDGRAGKFLDGLATIAFGWRELNMAMTAARESRSAMPVPPLPQPGPGAARLDAAAARQNWLSWVASTSDDELLGLYQLLGLGCRERRLRADLSGVPIIRIQNGERLSHVSGGDTYLPTTRDDADPAHVPAALAYFDDEDDPRTENLRAFYRAARVERWDETAVITRRLASYPGDDRPLPDGADLDRHLDDVRAFVAYGLRNRAAAAKLFGAVRFLLAPESDHAGAPRWVSPEETFIDLPFRATGLSALCQSPQLRLRFGGGTRHAPGTCPLAGMYLAVDDIEEFLDVAGARTGIAITGASVQANKAYRRQWSQNTRRSDYTTATDWEIRDFEQIIRTGDHDLLRTLWHSVVDAKTDKAYAVYQANARAERHTFASQLARALTSTAWILDRDGEMRLPRDITEDDLRGGWPVPPDGSLVRELDFGAAVAQRSRKEIEVSEYLRDEGLPEDGLALLRAMSEPGAREAVEEFLRDRKARDRFPDAASRDPARRAEVASRDAADAPRHSTTVRERSVVVGQQQAAAEARAYLREQYTTADGEMFCQACRKILPFRMRDGRWYFEAVDFVPSRAQVHRVNKVALCPLCAAMYQRVRDTGDAALLDELARLTVGPDQGAVHVPVVVNGTHVGLRFTGKHAIDLKAALGVAGASRNRSSPDSHASG